MTTLTKTIRRVTIEKYGYGRNSRKLVAAFEKGDLITIREHRRRTTDTARIYDVLCWMKRSKAAKAARLAARRQRAATRRLFSE